MDASTAQRRNRDAQQIYAQALRRAAVLLLSLVMTLSAGCGFRLRGEPQLPFAHAQVVADPASRLAPLLRQALQAQGRLALPDQNGTALRIRIADERQHKDILSLSGAGKVREYRLTYRVTLHVTDAGNRPLMDAVQLQQVRELTYSETATLAKEAEEATIIRHMEQEALRQALRRLAYVRP